VLNNDPEPFTHWVDRWGGGGVFEFIKEKIIILSKIISPTRPLWGKSIQKKGKIMRLNQFSSRKGKGGTDNDKGKIRDSGPFPERTI